MLVLGVGSLVLADCTTDNLAGQVDRKHIAASSRISSTGESTVKTKSIVGNQAATAARDRAVKKSIRYSTVGMASWYGEDFHGRKTANGETFDMNSFSAAHPSLPLPSNVRVTNLGNHRSVIVRVNDRGPYAGGRVIDVSAKTAKALGFYDDGVSKVKVEYVGRAQ